MVYSRENDDSTIVQDVMLRHHIASLNRRVIQYQENDTENLHTDTVNETVNSQIMEFFNISESTAKQPEISRNPDTSKGKIQTRLDIG